MLISGITNIDVDELKNATQYVFCLRYRHGKADVLLEWQAGRVVIPKSLGSGERFDPSRRKKGHAS